MRFRSGVGDVVGVVLVAMVATVIAIFSMLSTNLSSPLQTDTMADEELVRNGFDVKRRAALDKILKQEMDDDKYSDRTLQTVLSYVVSTQSNHIYVSGEKIQKSNAIDDIESEIEQDVLSEMNGVSPRNVDLDRLYKFKVDGPDTSISKGSITARSPTSKISEKIQVEGAETQIVFRLRTSEQYSP